MEIVDVWINCPSEEVADRIAEALIGRRLAACANRHAPIQSAWHWQGAVERGTEVPLLLKTRAALFDRLAEAARGMHPFEVPAITAVPVSHAIADYRDWVIAETEEAR
jgi:periplasmic divalent cation tolerance protein